MALGTESQNHAVRTLYQQINAILKEYRITLHPMEVDELETPGVLYHWRWVEYRPNVSLVLCIVNDPPTDHLMVTLSRHQANDGILLAGCTVDAAGSIDHFWRTGSTNISSQEFFEYITDLAQDIHPSI